MQNIGVPQPQIYSNGKQIREGSWTSIRFDSIWWNEAYISFDFFSYFHYIQIPIKTGRKLFTELNRVRLKHAIKSMNDIFYKRSDNLRLWNEFILYMFEKNFRNKNDMAFKRNLSMRVSVCLCACVKANAMLLITTIKYIIIFCVIK